MNSTHTAKKKKATTATGSGRGDGSRRPAQSTTKTTTATTTSMTATKSGRRRSLMNATSTHAEERRSRVTALCSSVRAQLQPGLTARAAGEAAEASAAVPVQAVGEHLQRQVQELVRHLGGQCSTAHNDRRVLLLHAFLESEAAVGMTPRMMLAGMDQVLAWYAEAVLRGELSEVAWEGAGAAEGEEGLPAPGGSDSRNKTSATATAAGGGASYQEVLLTMDDEVPVLPVEAFLPPLIQQSAASTNVTLLATMTAAANAANATNSLLLPTNTTTNATTTAAAAAKSKVSSHVPPPQKRADTMPLALEQLLLYCAKPFICLDLQDQRDLPEAIQVLSTRLAQMVLQMESLQQERGAELAARIRVAALRAMVAQLAPLLADADEGAEDKQHKTTTTTATTVDTVRSATVKDSNFQLDEPLRDVLSRWSVILMMQHGKEKEGAAAGGATRPAGQRDRKLWLDSAHNVQSRSAEARHEEAGRRAAAGDSPRDGDGLDDARRAFSTASEMALLLQWLNAMMTLDQEKQCHVDFLASRQDGSAQTASTMLPLLAVNTLAGCAPGDQCGVLCFDLLWALVRRSPAQTAQVVLHYTKLTPNTCPMEDLFFTLVNQLNASHRATERELRNDMVVFLSVLLREDRHAVEDGEDGSAYQPLPPATVDAINAIVLLLFDLLCGAELSTPGEAGGDLSATTLASRIPLLTQRSARLYNTRYSGVASPTLRGDNLQFKRLGWQLFVSFCAWQAARVRVEVGLYERSLPSPARGAERPEGTVVVPYSGLFLVDLCRLGLVDVLLLYVDVLCDHPIVVAWTREELVLLQGEAWMNLAALIALTRPLQELDPQLLQRCRCASMAAVAPTPAHGRSTHVDVDADALAEHHQSPHGKQQQQQQREAADPAADAAAKEGEDDEEGGAAVVLEISAEEAEEDEEEDLLAAADVHFLAAAGVPITLRYIYDAPVEMERLKRHALALLATAMQYASLEVRAAIVETKDLVPLVMELLESVHLAATGAAAPLGAPSDLGSTPTATAATATVSGRKGGLALAPAALSLALEGFSLLKNIADTAATTTGWIHALPSMSGQQRCAENAQEEEAEGGEAADGAEPQPISPGVDESTPRTQAQEVPFIFSSLGGEAALVGWLQQCAVAGPQLQGTVPAAATTTTTTTTTTQRGARPAPLSEAYLFQHLDLLLAVLDTMRALVLNCSSNETSYVEADGVEALLAVVEALALGADALPPKEGFTQDAQVWVRDPELVQRVARGYPDALAARQDAFREVLTFALTMLADLVYNNTQARDRFLLWRSQRLAKKHAEGVDDAHLSAVQLLLKLFEKEVDPAMLQHTSGAALPQEEPLLGLQLLHINERGKLRRGLEREYVRRLLRKKALLVEEGGSSLEPQEVLRYDQFLEGNRHPSLADAAVSQLSDAEKEVVIDRMSGLMAISDKRSEVLNTRQLAELVRQYLPIGIKVFSCMSSVGFDYFTATSGHPVAAALSPAERSCLVLLAALPSLLTDEFCLTMAEAADVPLDAVAPPLLTEEAVTALGMRPVPPDYRCLVGVLQDVRARGREVRQLVALDLHAETVQQTQLFDRFLVAHVRHPVGINGGTATAAWSTRRRSSVGATPSVVVPLSPVATGRQPPAAAAAAAAASVTAPSPAATLSRPQLTGGGSYKPTLTQPRPPKNQVELRKKKEQMIKNSLRQLPQDVRKKEPS